MTPVDIFDKLAACGLSVEQALIATDLMINRSSQVKTADVGVIKKILEGGTGLLNSATNVGSLAMQGLNTATNMAGTAAPWLVAATAGPGYLAGRGVAKAMDVDRSDITEIQEEELIEELNANAERLRKQKQLQRA